MASIKGITIKLGADATELTNALHKADQSLRSTQSNLSEINKALKFNPNNVTLLKQKQVELNKAINETKSKLDTLKTALKQADAQGMSKTDEEYMKLQREILKTENQLKKFNDELKQTNAQSSKLGHLSANLKSVGDKLTSLGQSMRTVSTICAGMVASVGAVAYSTAVWADDLNTLSKITGIATDKLQLYALASDLVDTDVKTIATSIARMKKNMLSASKGTGDASLAFKKLGVNITDTNGNLRDQDDVFQELLKALGKMENETERDALAMAIFGRSATQLNPLIEDMGQTYADVAQMLKDNKLDIVDQATIDKANEFNDTIDKVKLNLAQAKIILGAKLDEAFSNDLEKIAGYMTTISTKLANMNPYLLKTITIISGIIAVLAPLLIVIGAVINALSILAAHPVVLIIGAVILGIGLMIARFKILYERCEIFRSAVDKIAPILQKVGAVIKKVFSSMNEIGGLLAVGLWKGISSKFNWLVARIKEFANGVKNKLKSFFGIKSPSRWARDVVGKNIVLGMAQGITSNASKVGTAMQSLIPSTTPTLASVSNEMANAVGTGLALSNSGATSGTFQVTVNLGGAKVAEQIYKLNKQGQLAMQG